jgi:ArsR family transcriptional regulator
MPTDNAQLTCASLLKVLADETRLSVVRQLIDGPKHVGQINEPLRLEQSLLSHHLKILRDAGLVRAERDGKAVLYSLLPEYQAAAKRDAIDLGCCLISFHS